MAVNTNTCTVKTTDLIDYLDYKNGDNPRFGPVKAQQMEKHIDSCLGCVRRTDQLMGMGDVEVFTDADDTGQWNQWLKSIVKKLRWNDQILPIRKGSKLEESLIEAKIEFADLKAKGTQVVEDKVVYISGHILKSLYRSEVFQKLKSTVTTIQLRDLSAEKTVIESVIEKSKYDPGEKTELLLRVVVPYGEKLYPLADQLRKETLKLIADGLAIRVEKIDIEIVDITL